MIERVEDGTTWTLTYNEENRLESVSAVIDFQNNEWISTYGGDGTRVKQVHKINSVVQTTNYYYMGGIMREDDGTSNTVFYLLKDNLSGTSVTVDAGGSIVGEPRYSAFGDTRYSSGSTPTTKRYTGQRQETDIGLYFYGSRWYDPSLGHFVQADTIIPDPYASQAYDRYAYTYNNPVNFTDPSGHGPCGAEPGEGEGAGCGEPPEPTGCSYTDTSRENMICWIPKSWADELPKDLPAQLESDFYLMLAWVYLWNAGTAGRLLATQILNNPDLQVEWDPDTPHNGYFVASENTIYISTNMKPDIKTMRPGVINEDVANMAATLGHEAWHYYNHKMGFNGSLQEEFIGAQLGNLIFAALTGQIRDSSILGIDNTNERQLREWARNHRRQTYWDHYKTYDSYTVLMYPR